MHRFGKNKNKGFGNNPRRVRGGIKARSERGEFAKNWWARRWLKAMENLLDVVRLQRGQGYARAGQVLSIEEHNGTVIARVQGSRSKPYKVSIGLQPLSNEQWEKVLDVLAEQAIFAAQLLAGEMPSNIEEAFSVAGVNLFPNRSSDLITSCSCPDRANPCKHVAAAHYILGNRFDEDPFLLFRLRGRTQEQILEGLRRHRSVLPEAENTEYEAEEEEEEGEDESQPVTISDKEMLAHFWQMRGSLDTFNVAVKSPEIQLPVFRRLGEPDVTGPESLEGLLEDAYKNVSQSALIIAFHGGEAGETVADNNTEDK